jgi:hypothetical protein
MTSKVIQSEQRQQLIEITLAYVNNNSHKSSQSESHPTQLKAQK